MIDRTFQKVIFLLIVIFLSMLVTNKYLGKWYESYFLLIGACFTLYLNYKKIIFSHNEERLVLFGVMAFLLALTGFYQQHQEFTRFGPVMVNYLKTLLPLTLLPMLYFSRIRGIEVLALSVVLAAFVAGGASIVDFINGFPRALRLHGSPIIFGDLAMLFGVLSLIFSALFYKKKLFVVFLLAGIVGIVSSLFSGSRGGWIVLFTLPFFLLAFLPKVERVRVGIATLAACFIIFILVFTTENQIKDRLFEASDEIVKIIDDDTYAEGSLGYRVQFWKISWQAFVTNPIFGIGVGEFYSFKKSLISSGSAPAHIESYKHGHSEYMGIMSNMGLVGIVFYATFFSWLWRLYYRAIKTNQFELKLLGVAGISTIVCYIDFSISESFLSSHLGGGAFYFLMTFYIYLMSRLKAQ